MVKQISVITPTYNRSTLLHRLYCSLVDQTYKDFEWIVVDDGSKDDTEQVVRSLIKNSKFEIKYVKKKNGGKPSAHNTGVKLAESELTIICDDDDYLTPSALEVVNRYWNKYSGPEVGGCIGYRGESATELLRGKTFGTNKTVSTLGEVFCHEIFDTTQIYRTKILQENLFPITAGEKFVPEIWLWKKIDQSYKLIVIPEILEVCKYLENGLTKSKSQTMWNNPMGYAYYFYQEYGLSKGFRRVKNCGVYRALVRLAGKEKAKKITLIDSILSWPIMIFVLIKSMFAKK